MRDLRPIVVVSASLLPFTLAGSALAQNAAPPGPPPPVAAAQPAPTAPPEAAPPTVVAPTEEEGRTAKNSVFAELLGNRLFYSINYERFIIDDVSLRVGFSYLGISAGSADGTSSASASLITVPILANYYLGGMNHKLQLGAGVTIIDLSASTSSSFGTGAVGDSFNGFGALGTAVVGYRYIPSHGGFNFGVAFTPLFGPGGFAGWGGMSFGGGF